MTRFILHLCTLCAIFLMSSCEKAIIKADSEVSGSSNDKDANLRVTVFQIEKTPFSTFTRAEKPVSEACTRLNFVIYDMDGTRVKHIDQESSNTNFGTASFKLEQGDYLLVVVGHSSKGNPTTTDPTCIKFTNALGYTDTFIYCASVTIGEESVEKQVALDRIVALCRFVITDDFPSDVEKMRFYYTGGSGAFDATTGLGCVNSKQDVKFNVTADKKQFDLYTFLHDIEGTIHLTVTALDGSGNELYNRTFDVPMQQNYITWLSGAYFNGSGSSSTDVTKVTVNTDWAGENHITF